MRDLHRGQGDSAEAFGERWCVHAHADAEMIRHPEKGARNNGGFVFLAEAGEERIHATEFQEGEAGGAELAADCFEVVTLRAGEEGYEKSAIGVDDCPRTFANFVEMLKSDGADQFGGVGGHDGEEIV